MKRILTCAALVCVLFPAVTAAESRLFVPLFRTGPGQDTQLLFMNTKDTAVPVELWAFSSEGQLLGQFQLWLAAHQSRGLAIRDAFRLGDHSVQGWIGAVSPDDGIQLSYSVRGERTSAFDAVTTGSHEIVLDGVKTGQEVHVANPNPTTADVVLRHLGASGAFLGIEEHQIDPFCILQVPVPAADSIARVEVTSNLEVFGQLEEAGAAPTVTSAFGERTRTKLELVIESDQPIGAYQVTIRSGTDPVFARRCGSRFEPGIRHYTVGCRHRQSRRRPYDRLVPGRACTERVRDCRQSECRGFGGV